MRSSNLFLAFLVALPAALPAPRAHASALVLPALVLPALVLPAQADRSELVRELVDSPFLASGDVDGWVDRVVELLLAQKGPPSPVDEAALQLLARRGDELADPARWPEVLERLALVSTLDAHARSFLARLTTEERLARMDTDALRRSREHDAFPEYLASFRILAPLAGPETGAPVSLAALSADPGFEREHAGLRGERVRWSIGKREPLRTEIAPAEWMEPVEGWCVLAFEFDAEHGGAAAIEFDLHGSYALRSLPFLLARDRSWRASVGDPTWSYSIDGGAPVTVDAVARETAPVVLAPFELRAGRNRVLVLCKADAYSSFALRVLVPDGAGVSGGKPLVLAPVDGAGLSPERSRLGRGTGAPGAQCASFEERLPREAPDELALLGVLLAGDQRPIAGLEFLRRATTAAPDRVGLAALFARTQNDAPYLPEAWRRSQSRAKCAALAARGANLDVELALARTQVLEDHEEEALLRLDRAREQFARTPAPLLELARTYPKLELDKAGDDAHDAAAVLAPRAARVIDADADRLEARGRRTLAAAARERLVDGVGGYASNLQSLAAARASAGDVAGALGAFERARLRSGRLGLTSELSDFHFERGAWDAADALQAELARAYPRWAEPVLRRAEIARRRSRAEEERALLEEARRRDPSSRAARARLSALGVPDETEQLFARFRADRAAALASYDGARWNDSVVRVLDSQVLRVYPDGSTESETHELLHLKDLDGCKREGTQRAGGTVEKLVTLKAASGNEAPIELEPVEVDGEYVMPSLKPGDFIERVIREESGAPEEGLQGLGSWRFASMDEPYHVSRYVVILAAGHSLELAERRFTGTHAVLKEGALEIHVFEMRDTERVQHEPGAPPPNWVLPWVQFGTRRDVAATMRHVLFETARLSARPTPEIEAKARDIVAGVEGEEARARALHAFVGKTVRTPNVGSATSAITTLLQEEGNPAHLYSALLTAAGIEHELAWSTNFSPECDPRGDNPFPEFGRFGSRMLVRVRPRGGREAWCDLAIRDLPYGAILGNAPRAEALTPAGVVHLPDLALEERTGSKLAIELAVGDDGGADASMRLETTGNGGYIGKDRFKQLPEAQRKAALGQVFARMLPGFELAELELPDLETGPLVLVGRGRVRKLLDQDGDAWTLKFPAPALNLSAGLAGGEGERKLPYFLGNAIVSVVDVKLTLPEGLRLVDGPPKTNTSWQGGRFELSIEPENERSLRLTRKLLLAPFYIQPNDYPRFAQFCAQADEVERVPLRFSK